MINTFAPHRIIGVGLLDEKLMFRQKEMGMKSPRASSPLQYA
tara:strand:- start:284 stop:409 length:126 start_codon:yes stop_codon:yes gene_type:complete